MDPMCLEEQEGDKAYVQHGDQDEDEKYDQEDNKQDVLEHDDQAFRTEEDSSIDTDVGENWENSEMCIEDEG